MRHQWGGRWAFIASAFNGPGERLNLVSMNGNLNKGEWKSMENTWASALKEGRGSGED